MKTQTKHTRESILSLLEKRDEAITRGIVAIWRYQTSSEKVTGTTNQDNGVGFNGADAPLLTSFAEQINRGRTLSEKQMGWARKKMPKYAGQLARIANAKQ